MVKGILADVNVIGQVAYVVERMQQEPWTEFWWELGLTLYEFEDVGLNPTCTDVEIWQRCQERELILITDNRNDNSADSMVAAIRNFNTPTALPVFTIADLGKFAMDPPYMERVVRTVYDYLLRVDELRWAGRLFLP